MSTSRSAAAAVVASLVLVTTGCVASGALAEPEPSASAPAATAPASPSPSVEPEPSASPEPSPSEAAPEAEPWVEAGTASGTIALSMPADWAVVGEREEPGRSHLELVDGDGVFALRVSYDEGDDARWCDDQGGWTILDAEPVQPFAAAGQEAVELTTLTRGDDYVLVIMLQASDVAAGCYPQAALEVDGGSATVSTTYRSGGRGHGWLPDVTSTQFLESEAYADILQVMRTVEITPWPA